MEGETVIAGVDTHKDVHVLCLLDGLGRKIRSGGFGADPEGYDRLAEAIGDPGSCMVVGVEGTASYGAGLTRRLVELGYGRRPAARSSPSTSASARCWRRTRPRCSASRAAARRPPPPWSWPPATTPAG